MKTSIFAQVIHTAYETIFPTTCRGCGVYGVIACSKCLDEARVLDKQCFFCGRYSSKNSICSHCRPPSLLNGIVWPFLYRKKVISKLVGDLKYKKRRRIANVIGEHIRESLRAKKFPDDAMLVPIPLAPLRERERGFNQSLLIAQNIGRNAVKDILIRIRETPPQARTVSREKRFEQMRGAFLVPEPKKAKDNAFILIDDVSTTGATISEAARSLKNAGAKDVYAAVFAH